MALATMAIDWEAKVLSRGDWDYKVNPAGWMPAEGIFLLYGQLITTADYGNINYGYTGTIIGFGEKSLFTGGGWAAGNNNEAGAPLYGDSQVDHDFIQKGIDMAASQSLGYNGALFNQDVRPLLDMLKEGKSVFLNGVMGLLG